MKVLFASPLKCSINIFQIMNAINAQPWIHEDLTAVISHFLSIVQTMYQRCRSSLEVLFSSVGCQDLGPTQLLTDYLEVMDFINDAIVSMDAFVNAYNQSAVYFSSPVEISHGNEEMLTTLARLHDSLLPSLQQGFRIIFASKDNGSSDVSSSMHCNVYLSLKMLSTRIVSFGWKLLYLCYLSDEAFNGSYPIHVGIKMFPSNVEDPIIRTDILLQIIRDINAVYLQSLERHSKGTFLQRIEENHKIMSKIQLLRNAGWFSIDDDQYQFVAGILSNSLPDNINAPDIPSMGKNGTPQVDEDTAIIESQISQIRDLFPEYGKGFLAACLEVYNHDPEEVIQRILEGTLHKDLQSLDISLEETPKPKSSLSISLTSTNDKGKGKLLESSEQVPPRKSIQTGNSSNSSSTSSVVGRYVRKTGTDLPDPLILNSRSQADVARTVALASQFEEYEDEYDDSFDDLGVSISGSALEETETLDNKLNLDRGGKSTGVDNNALNYKLNLSKKPQFYVKDGKNYSYKVEGSIAVSNSDEASLVNQAQKEVIHGLGRGGNLPMGAVRRMMTVEFVPEQVRGEGQGKQSGRGFGRGYISSSGASQKPIVTNVEENGDNRMKEGALRGGQGGDSRGRGGQGSGRGKNHYRRDRAMKKHMAGVTGHW
ncbi:unnamed protein product [Cuscuta campestris]|uniref:CUE domain-containing protein n=1 Tax=Cuscuta campestris TaxID=132261 RepID=A0A484NEX8_9ASTE|nr:unnamed protein product [Cuscuta campestris]